jgi:hypothetical protein
MQRTLVPDGHDGVISARNANDPDSRILPFGRIHGEDRLGDIGDAEGSPLHLFQLDKRVFFLIGLALALPQFQEFLGPGTVEGQQQDEGLKQDNSFHWSPLSHRPSLAKDKQVTLCSQVDCFISDRSDHLHESAYRRSHLPEYYACADSPSASQPERP